jgi:hypothetical protein
MAQMQSGTGATPSRPKEIGGNYGDTNWTDSPGRAAEDAASVARDLGDKARQAGEALRDQTAHLADSAKELADQARDKLMDKVGEQKGVGADYIETVAKTMNRAADQFDQLPFAATYIRGAAGYVESVAQSVRNGDPGDLVRQAQDFARRQPTLAMGVSMLAGFGLVRLLKNAAQSPSTSAPRAKTGSRPSWNLDDDWRSNIEMSRDADAPTTPGSGVGPGPGFTPQSQTTNTRSGG